MIGIHGKSIVSPIKIWGFKTKRVISLNVMVSLKKILEKKSGCFQQKRWGNHEKVMQGLHWNYKGSQWTSGVSGENLGVWWKLGVSVDSGLGGSPIKNNGTAMMMFSHTLLLIKCKMFLKITLINKKLLITFIDINNASKPIILLKWLQEILKV